MARRGSSCRTATGDTWPSAWSRSPRIRPWWRGWGVARGPSPSRSRGTGPLALPRRTCSASSLREDDPMRTTITTRHCDVPDELRARARELVGRLAKVAPRPHDAQVILGADHGTAAVEVRLHTARGRVYVGRSAGPDHRSALDRAG